MSSLRPTAVLENSLIIAVPLSKAELMHFVTFEAIYAIDRGFRASKNIAFVFGFFEDLDSTFDDPTIDPLRVDVELLGHFDDRVPRCPIAAAEPAQTRTNLVLATVVRDELRREPPSLARCESFPLQMLSDRNVGFQMPRARLVHRQRRCGERV
jgi:hypothetical protein